MLTAVSPSAESPSGVGRRLGRVALFRSECLPKSLLQVALGLALLFEGSASHAVSQDERSDLGDIVAVDVGASIEARVGSSSTRHHEVCAVSVDLEIGAESRDAEEKLVAELDRG